MKYRIFIGYSHEDDDKAQYIHDCLSRIEEFIPYKAERYPIAGEDFKERLQWNLEQSFAMVVLLTEHGKNSQWVNQEIGFANALKRRPRRQVLPHIIPVSHKEVKLKGFITKDTADILFFNDYYSWGDDDMKYFVYDIVAQIRLQIPKGLEEGGLHLRMTCHNCRDKRGYPHEYSGRLPSHKELLKAIELKRFMLEYTCPKCKASNFVDARCFSPYPQNTQS